MLYWESLQLLDKIILIASGFLFLAQIYFYIRYMRVRGKGSKGDKVTKDQVQGVSVLVCAHNEAYNLSAYLYALLSQDYPLYEVIVVDDGSEDSTRAIIESYMVQDKRLRTTFVPKEARVRSTKKLALTLAAKAAQYDYLLLTDADCCPESPHWISEMMKGFEQNPSSKEVVLGYGAYFYEKGFVNRLVRYDTLFNGLHYLGAALCGHPYMGVGRNLAYKKSLFFETGGFKNMMNNRAGDDDLFVNHVATGTNTAVVLTPASFTWSPSKTTLKEWLQQKRRHLSVSPQYRWGTKIRLALEPTIRGLFYLLVPVVLVLLLAMPAGTLSWMVALWVAALFLVRWLVQTIVLNVSAKRMGQRGFNMFTILGMDICLPLVSLYMLCVPKKQNKW